MSARAALLHRGRRAAERGMVDTCIIRRATGTQTRDDNSGTVTDEKAPVYTGKCRFQQAQIQADQHDVGEDYVLLQRTDLQLPMSVVGLQVGDEVEALTSLSDPDLPGRVFLVRDLAHKTDATARRVTVTERTD